MGGALDRKFHDCGHGMTWGATLHPVPCVTCARGKLGIVYNGKLKIEN
jgi:hypothetical protein